MARLQRTLFLIVLFCFTVGGSLAACAEEGNTAQTVVICIEKFTLGQGYARVPTRMALEPGDTAASVLVRFLGEGNYRHTGALEDGSFNLTGVYDPCEEPVKIPAYICSQSGVAEEQFLAQGRAQADWLGEFDYHSQGGWMYLVNSEFLDVSAANYRPKDGDVIRFAFSLAGWGMDLGANYSGDPADSWVEPANRDRLMTLVSDIDAREDREYLMQQPAFVHAWEAAVCLLTDMEVHQPDMDRAEGVLRHAMEDASQQRIDFDDLRGHWAEKAVDRAVQQQIMVGTGNRLFEPDRSITRAEFAAVLCRVLGLEQMTEQDFTDVGGEWYCGYVGSVAHYGIMCGKGNDVFEPFAPITREQAAVALQAAARLVGKATVTTPESVESILGSYSDAGLCSLWSREAVAFCSAVGLMTDYNGRFEPLKPVSRAQAAQIAVRMIDVLEN